MKSDQQKPKTLLAVALSMLFIFVYYTWISPPAPPATPKKNVSEPIVENKIIQTAPSVVVPENLPPPKEVGMDDTVSINGTKIEAKVSSKGGALRSWMLGEYGTEKKQPIDLLNQGFAFWLTTGVREHDSTQDYDLRKINEKEVEAVFESDSVKIIKKFVPEANEHVMSMELEITNKGKGDLILDPRVWVLRDQKEAAPSKKGLLSFLHAPDDFFLPAFYGNGKFHAETAWGKVLEKTTQQGKIYWTGLADRYFLMGLVNREGGANVSTVYGRENQQVYTNLTYGGISLRPGEVLKRTYTMYLGPKKREELKLVGSYLETSVDYGFFSFMATPLLWLLIVIEKFVRNWGLAIIILTFIVKLLLHPINKKSMQSMKEMQKLQPKMKEVREKFKNDKERMNLEIMGLFKAHKVNPMGGCLPMLLQFPVYIALYRVLWNSVELYQAPFFGFYKDLSVPDPYMITPILLGIFMALQQKWSPQAATMDPAQAKVMMIMPIMFSAFMIFLPFGLNLYILVNVVMSVIQQYMIHHDLSFVGLTKKVLKR
ncbi:MAG TPA: hypothetical protein DDW49_04165 [Deltaproteobacteria bacterium]|nr:hypothetical protein [Deltaproteobacteria bacterium]